MSLLGGAAQGAVLGLASAAAPGPFQAVLVARSLRAGPLRALPLAFVPLASDPVAIAVVLLVLGQLPGGFLRALTGVGAAVVLWIAALTLRDALRGQGTSAAGADRASRGFVAAAAVNVTNPNAWIFWSAVGGPLVAAMWRASAAAALAFLAAFYACITAGNAVLALAAGGMARAGPRVARVLGLGSGLALAGFGLWQLARVIRG
jgi:threonine/homoserine/homoserine lactone efflux protein